MPGVHIFGEKLAKWRGKFSNDKLLWGKMIAVDLTREVPKADLPVYFFHGKYDYTVSYPLARAYLDKLQAPIKGFYKLGQSAHSPVLEEPRRMKQIMPQEILAGERRIP